jgi:hypothetical protein
MAHFAELNADNKVLRVIVVGNQDCLDATGTESEQVGISFCQSLLGVDTRWVQTSYNGTFRKYFAGAGFTYDESLDAFVPPQPFKGWVLNPDTVQWEPPTPRPTEGGIYEWDEETLGWVEVPAPDVENA